MKKKVLIVIILTLMSLIIINETRGMIIRLSNKQDVEDIKTVDILKNKKQTIAVMVQQDDNTWRAAENRNAWPSSTTYGFAGSKCYDGNGALVDSNEIVSFDLSTYTATINTTNSIYCTLYFAKGTPALELLQEKGGTTFASGNLTAIDGMYRFTGKYDQVTNNYICFGANNETECLSDKSKYLYRILGLTSENRDDIGLHKNQLKIIRPEILISDYRWAYSSSSYVSWDNSIIKQYLNSTFLNTIKNGKNGAYWDSVISSHKWYIGKQLGTKVDWSWGDSSYNYKGEYEPRTEFSQESKIGLMYVSDGYYSWTNYNGDYNSWLCLCAGVASYEDCNINGEWTMTNLGPIYPNRTDRYGAWGYRADGSVGNGVDGSGFDYDYTYDVRAVFYLLPGVNLTGEGTKDHPFIISGVMPQD